ncbi:unnamed protein product [Brassica napus]|uniref:(rape) hypothetical protein n=1 Tax=Brassica napus TaxID=3708 RepID=A0A817AZC7_BRANA|nr:unnamed protein product [Brassica napus]
MVETLTSFFSMMSQRDRILIPVFFLSSAFVLFCFCFFLYNFRV